MSPATPSFTVDTSQWPLVILTTVGKPSEEALEAHLREIEECVLNRREAFVQIVDQLRAEPLDATQRATIAEHQQAMEEVYATYCRGEAYVADARMKGVMIAVFWQAKPPYPYGFFENLDGARQWALDRMLEHSQKNQRSHQ